VEVIVASMGEVIRACRESLGKPPRQLSQDERRRFRISPSWFVKAMMNLSGDKLRVILRDQDVLRDHGCVVWGALVQANNSLFDPSNRQVLPAGVIYSPDPFFDGRVSVLQSIAQGLFELKGTVPVDKERRKLARAITGEVERLMRSPLPASITDRREVFLTTCLIQPSHLPAGHLAAGYFPLLICPEQTDAVMILPAWYWPKEAQEAWKQAVGS
jgi:hypothetical protein